MINETDQINDISQIKDYLENQFEYIYKGIVKMYIMINRI